jgi:hypothetical protein
LNGSNTPTEDSIDIIFKRPFPEPKFCINTDCSQSISYIEIEVRDEDNENPPRFITVHKNGQISVSIHRYASIQ